MDSFYGGKQGISFIIKERFASCNEMETAFGNSNYTKVWYNEYCIIDTVNKNDPDNGKVFRRTGYRGSEENTKNWPHAEYIGQIVGPAGGTPYLELGSLEYVEGQYDAHETLSSNESLYYLTATRAPQFSHIDDDLPEWEASATVTSTNNNVVYKSGKDYYNSITPSQSITPTLKYKWFNFRSAGSDEEGFGVGKIYVGLEIPYVDFDITEATSTGFTHSPQVIPHEYNKYYTGYSLVVPQGTPGRFVTNLTTKVMSGGECYILEDIDADNNIPTSATHSINNVSKGIFGNVQYYESGSPTPVTITKNGTPVDFYLWPAHDIKEINFNTNRDSADFGRFQVQYTDTANPSTITSVPLVQSITAAYDTSDGKYKLKVTYGTGTAATTITAGEIGPKVQVWAWPLTLVDGEPWISPPSGDPPAGGKHYPTDDESNLGVVSSGTTAIFYQYIPSGVTTPGWKQIGVSEGAKTNLEIIDADTFDIENINYPVIFIGSNTVSAVESETFGTWPWR